MAAPALPPSTRAAGSQPTVPPAAPLSWPRRHLPAAASSAHPLQGGDLAAALASDSEGRLRWGAHGRQVAIDVAEGVAFLHAQNVTHRCGPAAARGAGAGAGAGPGSRSCLCGQQLHGLCTHALPAALPQSSLSHRGVAPPRRDLKSNNILLTPDLRAKVADVGAAALGGASYLNGARRRACCAALRRRRGGLCA